MGDQQNSNLNQIRHIFMSYDTEGTNQMHESDLRNLLENKELEALMESIPIKAAEAHGLFKLLDVDNSGVISIDEFLSGCIRLKGTARALEVATLLYEMHKVIRKIKDIEQTMKSFIDCH